MPSRRLLQVQQRRKKAEAVLAEYRSSGKLHGGEFSEWMGGRHSSRECLAARGGGGRECLATGGGGGMLGQLQQAQPAGGGGFHSTINGGRAFSCLN